MNEVLTFDQAVRAALVGKDLQFSAAEGRPWIDSSHNGNKRELIKHVAIASNYAWRIKPDAFEESWQECISGDIKIPDNKSLARYFWNAAMEYKNNENI